MGHVSDATLNEDERWFHLFRQIYLLFSGRVAVVLRATMESESASSSIVAR